MLSGKCKVLSAEDEARRLKPLGNKRCYSSTERPELKEKQINGEQRQATMTTKWWQTVGNYN